MKINRNLAIVFFISFTLAGISAAGQEKEIQVNKLLKNIDLSHPVYCKKRYGEPKINKFETADGSILLSYQAMYGGDGDHSENILKLFLITGSASKKILDRNIDKVKFITENNRLKAIKGSYIATLCNVCDGWEVSEEAYIFTIPISINMENLKVSVELSETERKELLKRLDAQINKNVLEKSSYKFGQTSSVDNKYAKYAESVRRRIVNLLSNKSEETRSGN